jgi:hypothetical protein
MGCWPIDPTPNLEDQCISLCLVLSFDLSGKGGPTSSYTTAGIALWFIAPSKPPYPAKDAFVKVEILQGGTSNINVYEFLEFSLLKPTRFSLQLF